MRMRSKALRVFFKTRLIINVDNIILDKAVSAYKDTAPITRTVGKEKAQKQPLARAEFMKKMTHPVSYALNNKPNSHSAAADSEEMNVHSESSDDEDPKENPDLGVYDDDDVLRATYLNHHVAAASATAPHYNLDH